MGTVKPEGFKLEPSFMRSRQTLNSGNSSEVMTNQNTGWSPKPNTMKMEVPRLSGKNPQHWIFNIQEYFDNHKTSDDRGLLIVGLNLDGNAVKIEGEIKKDGRGPSILDDFSHAQGKIIDGNNADVVVNFYNRDKEDIDLIAKLGFKS
ncbi:hypothetical protein PTKIN_Ptkin18bG0106800 [Pterospermum kingtungense]